MTKDSRNKAQKRIQAAGDDFADGRIGDTRRGAKDACGLIWGA
jgi:hypothetical protein